jgi:hypothetical protein
MHLYNIRTKDGTEYNGVLLTDERGTVGNTLASILRDDPRIYIVRFIKAGNLLSSLKLLEIESAVCKQERVDAGPLRNVDELPRWLALHEVYTSHKQEIDMLHDATEKVRFAINQVIGLKRNL